MERQSLGNAANGRRTGDAVTCDARFTSAVFDGHALEARCYLGMSRVLADVDAGRSRQFAALARELAEFAGRFGHVDDVLIASEPMLAASAGRAAIVYRTPEFGAHGDGLCYSMEVRRRRSGFAVVFAERVHSDGGRDLGVEISASERNEFAEFTSAMLLADVARQEFLEREQADALAAQQAAVRERQVLTMVATYPWQGVVAAHEQDEPALDVVPRLWTKRRRRAPSACHSRRPPGCLNFEHLGLGAGTDSPTRPFGDSANQAQTAGRGIAEADHQLSFCAGAPDEDRHEDRHPE